MIDISHITPQGQAGLEIKHVLAEIINALENGGGSGDGITGILVDGSALPIDSGNVTLGNASLLSSGSEEGNVVVLGTDGKIDSTLLPAISITDTVVCTDTGITTEDELKAWASEQGLEQGDMIVVSNGTDLTGTYVVLADGGIQAISTPSAGAITGIVINGDAQIVDNGVVDIENVVFTEDLAEYITGEEVDAKLADYATKSDIADFITADALTPYATTEFVDEQVDDINNLINETKEAVESDIDTKIAEVEAKIPDVSDYLTKTEAEDTYTKLYFEKSGFLAYTLNKMVNTSKNDSFGEIFNETDGGGARYYDNLNNIVSYAGVNDGSESSTQNVYALLYVKDQTSGVGTRLQAYPDIICYSKTATSASGVYAAENELVVKSDIAKFITEEDLEGYLTKAEAEETYATKEDIPDVSNFTEKELTDVSAYTVNQITTTSTNNVAEIFNENGGGGARFKSVSNNVTSFAGVNDGTSEGIYAQLYAKDSTSGLGSRLNVYTDMICYSNTATGATGWHDEDHEIATKADIKAIAGVTKATIYNPELILDGDSYIWDITHTLDTADLTISIFKKSETSWEVVGASVVVSDDSTITVTVSSDAFEGAETVEAESLKAVIIG